MSDEPIFKKAKPHIIQVEAGEYELVCPQADLITPIYDLHIPKCPHCDALLSVNGYVPGVIE